VRHRYQYPWTVHTILLGPYYKSTDVFLYSTYVIFLYGCSSLLGSLPMYRVRLSGQVPSFTQGACAQGTEGSFCRLDNLNNIYLWKTSLAIQFKCSCHFPCVPIRSKYVGWGKNLPYLCISKSDVTKIKTWFPSQIIKIAINVLLFLQALSMVFSNIKRDENTF
jgi:hypothetical protein